MWDQNINESRSGELTRSAYYPGVVEEEGVCSHETMEADPSGGLVKLQKRARLTCAGFDDTKTAFMVTKVNVAPQQDDKI